MTADRGQATLELTLALVTGLLLVVGSIKVWLFFVQILVEEQRCYQVSRLPAGRNNNPGLEIRNIAGMGDGSPPPYNSPFWTNNQRPTLSIFGQIGLPNRCN